MYVHICSCPGSACCDCWSSWSYVLHKSILVSQHNFNLMHIGNKPVSLPACSCRADNIPFYVGTIVPIVLIFIFNWILYITIMVSVCHRLHSAAQVTNTNLSLRKLARTATVLSVVLGLGWAFGLVQTSAPVATSDAARVVLTVFQVLFSILVGLQGILMFGFYGIGNKKVREAWKRCFFRGKSKKVDLFSRSQSGPSPLKTGFLGKSTPWVIGIFVLLASYFVFIFFNDIVYFSSSGVNEYSEVPEKSTSVANSLYDQLTTADTQWVHF